jgi:hypothetical protein
MEPCDPQPVKLFCGVLFSDVLKKELAYERLEDLYGPIDYKSEIFAFDLTSYYVPEMGKPISRQFISFYRLIDPVHLPEIKIKCNGLEKGLAIENKRKVNLDPGYMDYDKVVLASAKYNAHKIYLSLGIYADLTLKYKQAHFHPSPYCFPDLKNGIYEKTFLHMRAKYKGQLRKHMKQKLS